MINKKIHYCWFDLNPLLELANKCISRWKKYCYNYEFIDLYESNFNMLIFDGRRRI